MERDDTIGVPLRDLGNGQWNVPQLTTLIAEVIPKATAVIDYEITHDFPHIGKRTFLVTARRMWKPDNNSMNILVVFSDVTNSRDREREGSLLLSELRHRMKNLLGVVRAIANQTETQGKTAENYKATFLARLEAVLKAQLLMAGGTSAVALQDLVSEVVGSLAGEALRLRGGPPAVLEEKQVLPMTMILHELATNALKYGALSDKGGTVDLSWTILPEGRSRSLRLVWAEKCTSPVSRPERTGMGTEIIQNGAKLGLNGRAELDFKPEGLVVTLVLPLTNNNG